MLKDILELIRKKHRTKKLTFSEAMKSLKELAGIIKNDAEIR